MFDADETAVHAPCCICSRQ